jgi:hypothetical protein
LDLVSMTIDRSIMVASVPAETKTFKALSSEARKKLRSLHELAFEVCLDGIYSEVKENDKLFIVSDDEEKEAPDMYRLLRRYKVRSPQVAERITAICFADDRYWAPLQAADLIAFVGRREREQKPATPSVLYAVVTKNGGVGLEYGWEEDGPGLGHVKRIRGMMEP